MAKSQKPEELVYVRPNSQLDMETRLANDNKVMPLLVGSSPDVVSEEGYIGTDVIYQNYANDTDKPYQAEEGVEADAEAAFILAAGNEPLVSDDHNERYATIARTEGESTSGAPSQRAGITPPATDDEVGAPVPPPAPPAS